MSQFFSATDIYIDIDPQKTLVTSENVSIINSFTPEDAFEQLAYVRQEYVRVTVFAHLDPYFIDTEGTIEFCRLCLSHKNKNKIIPVLPIDYGAIMRAQELQMSAVEIEASHPFFEKGITRPMIIKKILQDLEIPVWIGGIFSTEEKAQLSSWGCETLVHYQNQVTTT